MCHFSHSKYSVGVIGWVYFGLAPKSCPNNRYCMGVLLIFKNLRGGPA